jgi:DNA invertase Pin-like site-specific DNA recombinase
MKIIKIETEKDVVPKKKRVAAYCRVSSSKEAQLNSLSSQISYFSKLIQGCPDWEYCGVFADDITGTKDDRAEFRKLLALCKSGGIDMIITKSISRFARNTVTLLETVREIKSMSVDVYFQKEKIHSISKDGELMLSVLASFAQEESKSVSDNCKWRIRKKFEQGELTPFQMYGYIWKGGEITVNEEQAAIVRRIFADYIGGSGISKITKSLNADGIPAYCGGKWNTSSVAELLQQEKLTGNCLLQKTIIENHLTKRQIKNTGIAPQYYAEGTHTPIISMEIFEKAQTIRAERAAHVNRSKKQTYPFTSKILCGDCGKRYRRKVTQGKYTWQCQTFLELGKEHCKTSKQIPENILLGIAEEFGGADNITEIRVPEPNKLVFVLSNGEIHNRVWTDRSRADSWTDEMKEKARQRNLERKKEDAKSE